MNNNLTLALQDLASCKHKFQLWRSLAWMDIRMRYIGSMLGPFWITLSMVIFVAALSMIYTRLFHINIKTYIPFLSCSLMVWLYISAVITESCDCFLSSAEYIKSVKLPFSLFVYRMMTRNLIIFAHNAVVVIGLFLLFRQPMSLTMLWFIPGMCLVTLNLFAIALLLAVIGTRYRDIPPIVASMTQIIFFVSPITWMPELIGMGSKMIVFNPITHWLALTRDPLLGHTPALLSVYITVGLTALSMSLALSIFSTKRRCIPYWL